MNEQFKGLSICSALIVKHHKCFITKIYLNFKSFFDMLPILMNIHKKERGCIKYQYLDILHLIYKVFV